MEKPKLLFRTSELALLAAVEPRRIERWLEVENIYLDGIAFRPGEAKHRRFSELDVIRVAVIALLNDHGVSPLKVCSGLAEDLVDPYNFRSGNADTIPIEQRVEIVLRTLKEMKTFFKFYPEREQWVFAGVIERSDGKREYFGDEILGHHVAYLDLDAFLTINTGKIVDRYLDRLGKTEFEIEKEKYK